MELKHAVELLVQAKLIKPHNISPQVRNIVSSVHLPSPVDLETLSTRRLGIYEPEQFPGLIYHPDDLGSVCILIFSSGKCVIVGAKDMNEIQKALERLLKLAGLTDKNVFVSQE